MAAAAHAGARPGHSLHYGTYDYCASLQISAEYQSMEHPVADYAKDVMQVAVAGTGVQLSDGSTNILPVGDERRGRPGSCTAGWSAGRWSAASTRAGTCTPPSCPPASSPTSPSTGEGFPPPPPGSATTWTRPRPAIMDEPATARALARFVLRGVRAAPSAPRKSWRWPASDPPNSTALAHPRLANTADPLLQKESHP